MEENKTPSRDAETPARKGGGKRALAFVLAALLLMGAGFALSYRYVEVEDNLFATGTISIDLNGGLAVIRPEEYLFEPGMTVDKPFYIANIGTGDAWCRLYISNAEGVLADILECSVLDEAGNTLVSGSMRALENRMAMEQALLLAVGERRDLILRLHYPESGGNDGQNRDLSFELSAVAVQSKNNPDAQLNG